MFGLLNDWITPSPVSYLVIAGLAVADIIGVLPSEAVVVTATLLAIDGDLLIPAIAAAAVIGALTGDNILYLLGRRYGDSVVDWMFRSARSRERLAWIRRQMHRHGSGIVVVGRMIPMGRTATMFAAGGLGIRWRRFIVADALGVMVWAGYWVGVTVVLGETFTQRQWLPILISVGIAVVVGLVVEVIRRRSRPPDRVEP